MQQQNNYHYTFKELKTYLYSYSDLFQQDRVQDGIHLYSKNAKKVYEEMLKVDDKIKEKQEKYNKQINEKRAKMAEAIQAYAQKHRDDKSFNENMLKDKDIQQCQRDIAKLETDLNDAVKAEQDNFMQWERKEMKGNNVILRNNNYVSAAGKSKAVKKGLIGANEIASFGNIDMKNSKNETLSGNLADIVHSITNLLHKKAQTEKDEAKKGEIEKVIQTIIDGVKDFFGIQKDDKKQLEEQSKNLNKAITMVIEKYLDNNFKQVQTNLEAIQKQDKQGKINYQSETKDMSDLRSDATSEKDDTASKIKQVLYGKNEEPVIDDKDKQALTSANQNKQQANINEQNNNNKNINTTKLLDKKETENKSQTNTKRDEKIKNAIQEKNKAIDIEGRELSPAEFQKNKQDFIDKESELNKNNFKNDAIEDDIDEDDVTIINEDGDDMVEIAEEYPERKVKKNKTNANANSLQEVTSKNNKENKEKLNFDRHIFIKNNNKRSTLNNNINNKSQTKTNNNIKISINTRSQKNNTNIKVPTITTGKVINIAERKI